MQSFNKVSMRRRIGRLLLSRFIKSKNGTAAIEFGIVAIPFFMFLMGIMEISVLFFGGVALENGMVEAARQIRTGQLQFGGGGANQFRNIVCDSIDAFMSCDPSELYIDVRTFDDFGNVNFEDPLEDDDLGDDLQFDPGQGGDVILVRVFYTWDVITPLIGELFVNTSDDYRLVASGMAFRNEPF